MQIIVCGAGKSGSSIAEKLSQLGNEVTIIDSSPELVKKLTGKLDIRGVVGPVSYTHLTLPTNRIV